MHIGKNIKKVLKERGISITEFARRISTHRRNVYDIFERESVDTALLQKISKVLDYDFFIDYQIKYEAATVANEKITTYENPDKSTFLTELLQEKLAYSLKEINYLKELIKEKDKLIGLLECSSGKKG